MKKLSILTLLLALSAATAWAQRFEPNTKWPYLYEEFTPGVIYFEGNQKSEAELNIHLRGNVLHYVAPDGRIMESRERGVVRVEIGGVPYLYFRPQLMELVANEGNNVLLRLVRGDFDSMQSSGGAYGASLNSSATSDLSSLDLGGLGNPELGKLLQERGDGRTIPLLTEFFFVIDGQRVKADKSTVARLVPAGRSAEWKKFLKDNKIKWKDEQSLRKVLVFLSAK